MNFSRIYAFSLALFGVLILLLPKLVGIAFILLFLTVIYGVSKRLLAFKLTVIPSLFILLYVIYMLYIGFTRNPDQATKYVENKIAFVLFPLLLAFKPIFRINWSIPIKAYLISLGALIVHGFVISCFCFMREGSDYHCFLSSLLSTLHHPTYTAAYVVFGMCILYFGYKKSYIGFSKFWVYPALGMLFLYSMLLLSLAGILFLLAFTAIFFLLKIYQRYGKIVAFFSAIATPILLYFTIIGIPQIEGEWSGAKWYVDQYLKNPTAFVEQHKYPMSGSEVRLVMWTISGDLCAKYPFGVGTGNLDEVLGTRLRELGQSEMARENYNPHNQFLQIALEIGVFGLTTFLLLMGFCIRTAFKYKNWILLIVILNLVFNCLFESMLQLQSGIIFYSFVSVLLNLANQEMHPNKVDIV